MLVGHLAPPDGGGRLVVELSKEEAGELGRLLTEAAEA